MLLLLLLSLSQLCTVMHKHVSDCEVLQCRFFTIAFVELTVSSRHYVGIASIYFFFMWHVPGNDNEFQRLIVSGANLNAKDQNGN